MAARQWTLLALGRLDSEIPVIGLSFSQSNTFVVHLVFLSCFGRKKLIKSIAEPSDVKLGSKL
jgi:hypothetical protein